MRVLARVTALGRRFPWLFGLRSGVPGIDQSRLHTFGGLVHFRRVQAVRSGVQNANRAGLQVGAARPPRQSTLSSRQPGVAAGLLRTPAAVLALLLLTGCFVPRQQSTPSGPECTRCHGDSQREGPLAARSSPPFDTFGNTDVSFPGVGAHLRHLTASDRHGAVACSACHPVPEVTSQEGHNDGVVQVVLGGRDGGAPASWDLSSRTCSNSACHGAASGGWTRPRTPAETCGACHASPPPAPHPQYQDCGVCHGEVLRRATFIAPEKHVDGTVQVVAASCASCHGSDDAGIPPRSLDGGTLASQSGVGAHTAHRTGGTSSKPVACETCHVVPTTTAHPTGGVVEVNASLRWEPTTARCTTSCHGPSASPGWTSVDAGLTCSSCHGAPPAAPHPPVIQCALCHGVPERARHVDGLVQVNVPTACNGCHGSPVNEGPPSDLSGLSDTSRVGVGAHQAHLSPRGPARPVACAECHVVPAAVDAGTHLDGVTQVRFTGVARANGAAPTWNGMTCASSACHDSAVWRGSPGGGSSPAPTWTRVDGTQRTCTSCHGAPPPAPHVQRSDCFACHQSAAPDGGFVRPDLHVNGRVDFFVP